MSKTITLLLLIFWGLWKTIQKFFQLREESPSATITFDGLIIMDYKEQQRLGVAWIHTKAEGHQLEINVEELKNETVLRQETIDISHDDLRKSGPLWLYVDSGEGLRVNQGSAEKYNPGKLVDKRSFDYVFSFEEVYKPRRLEYNREVLTPLYIPQGLIYSDGVSQHRVYELAPGENPDKVTPKFEDEFAVRVAVNINRGADSQVQKSIVLADQFKKTIFSYPLQKDTHYRISLENGPISRQINHETNEHSHQEPQDHFLQFYEAMDIKPFEKKYYVKGIQMERSLQSPPCDIVQGNVEF